MMEQLHRIAQEVGGLLLDIRQRGAVQGAWEGTQFKALADAEAHRLWCRRLKEEFPWMPIVSEEDPGSFACAGRGEYWLIDPIDGTASYAEGYAGFVTQAAYVRQGQPEAAVIFAPALELCYRAQQGRGATRNGTLIRNAAPDRVELLTDNYPQPRGTAQEVMTKLNITRYVESGSIGLKLCRVAEGTADVFVKTVPVKPWDLAPGDLLLSEIGGFLTDAGGHRVAYTDVVTVNGLIAARSRRTLDRVLGILPGGSQ